MVEWDTKSTTQCCHLDSFPSSESLNNIEAIQVHHTPDTLSRCFHIDVSSLLLEEIFLEAALSSISGYSRPELQTNKK